MKTVSLPELTYTELVSLAGELTMISKKPISLGMTVAILISVYKTVDDFLPGFTDKLAKRLSETETRSPAEFEQQLEDLYKSIVGEGQPP